MARANIVRRRWNLPKRKLKTKQDDAPLIRGVTAGEPLDEQEIYDRAVREWHKTERLYRRQTSQEIRFKQSPIALAFIGDLHLGSPGTDYERAFGEAEIIAKTPRMYAILCGDLLDNFIVPKLMAARMNSAIGIQDEWTLVRRYLKAIAPKLLASIEGNHERFSFLLAHIDYFKDVLEAIKPAALYDTDDAFIDIQVGNAHFPTRIRHHWRYRSVYNLTHGIEQAHRYDGGFLIGVGAHTHASGVIRGFNARGENGVAILCGSYKRYDPYAKRLGFAKHNTNTAQTVILFDDGTKIASEDLRRAAEMMKRYAR